MSERLNDGFFFSIHVFSVRNILFDFFDGTGIMLRFSSSDGISLDVICFSNFVFRPAVAIDYLQFFPILGSFSI